VTDPAATTTRRILLVGDGPLADGLAGGLRLEDAAVTAVSSATCTFGDEPAVARALAASIDDVGGPDLVVHAWVAPSLVTPRPFVDLDEAAWAEGCERTLEVAWWVTRAVAAPLAAASGALVFVVPTIGLSGGAEFSMLAAAAEGVRALAKSCGRQWGASGVTVNTLAAAPHHWVGADAGAALTRSVSLSTPALGGPGDAGVDLAPLVALLASPGAHFVTAGTLVADGGIWMGL
jgi:NAD(P)-dependent dehydrogenase (short-subunit alcohol dehydrogenase family)